MNFVAKPVNSSSAVIFLLMKFAAMSSVLISLSADISVCCRPTQITYVHPRSLILSFRCDVVEGLEVESLGIEVEVMPGMLRLEVDRW